MIKGQNDIVSESDVSVLYKFQILSLVIATRSLHFKTIPTLCWCTTFTKQTSISQRLMWQLAEGVTVTIHGAVTHPHNPFCVTTSTSIT